MRLEVFPDRPATHHAAAEVLARAAREAVDQRGRCVMGCSGGADPWEMYRLLALEPLPWERVHIVQVDERIAPPEDDARNWKHLRANLIERVPLPASHAHPMPVEEKDLAAAACRYAGVLSAAAGEPPIIDVAHLGLGSDGHTASLVPGDGVLGVNDREVAITQPYQGYRRMTLTYPALNRARCLVWLITGESKAHALARLLKGDASVPAGAVNPAHALVLADRQAASLLRSAAGAT